MNALIVKSNPKCEFVTPVKIENVPQPKVRTETIYRRNKHSIDRVIEYDANTEEKLRVIHYDYFNTDKIRAIDEFVPQTGKKYRTINYVLYKSIDEFDTESGKRIRTINYDIKNENCITSIQEYDLDNNKIKRVILFRSDGQTISTIKEINPKTENVVKWTSFRETKTISSISEYNEVSGKPCKTTYFYCDGETVREIHNYNPLNGEWKDYIRFDKREKMIETKIAPKYKKEKEQESIAQLIDNLYGRAGGARLSMV